MLRIPYQDLFDALLRVLLKLEFTPGRARLCAQLFADTTRDGVYSHGLNRFPRFVSMIRNGYIDIHAAPALVTASGPTGALGRKPRTGQSERPAQHGASHRPSP